MGTVLQSGVKRDEGRILHGYDLRCCRTVTGLVELTMQRCIKDSQVILCPHEARQGRWLLFNSILSF